MPISDMTEQSRFRAIAAPILALALVLMAGLSGARADDLEEQSTFFRVSIGVRTYRLEGLVVKKADAAGRLPIALITHGKAVELGRMLDNHATTLAPQARDLARRGWLAVVVTRRGFGASDGPMPAGANCKTISFADTFNAAADDLQAVLELVAQRPDADPTRAIAIGVSAGGAAVVALGARNPKGLVGVINVSGGLRMETCPKDDVLASTFRDLGAKSRVPNLWLYASNDSLFPVETVGRMQTGFLDGGGDVKLVMFDPLGQEGHTLFVAAAGRQKWLAEMDGFLRHKNLPTYQRQGVDALMKRLNAPASARSFYENYLAAPSQKLLVLSSTGKQWFYQYGGGKIESTRDVLMKRCQDAQPDPCVVMMENDTWVAPLP